MTIEAYKVAVNLELTGNPEKALQAFIRTILRADEAVKNLNKNLLPTSKYFKEINLESNLATKSFQKLNSQTNSTGNAFRSLNNSLISTKKMMSEVKMEANSLGSSMGRAFVGANGNIQYDKGKMSAIGKMGWMGAGIGAAYGAARFGAASYSAGTQYQQESIQLGAQNIPGLSTAEANRFVNQSSRKSGISKLDLMTALNDAAVITKDKINAERVAPTVAEMGYIAKIAFGHSDYKMTNSQLQDAIKVAEITGASKSSAVLNPALAMMLKTTLSTSGRVNPSTELAALRAMGGHAKGMSPDFFFYGLEPLMQEYGVRTGRMINTFYQHLGAGRLTTQAAQQLVKFGLVNKDAINYTKIGTVKSINPGAVKGQELMNSDPYAWMDKFLIPALLKGGYKTTGQQANILGKIFTNSDLTFVNTYLQQHEKINQNRVANRRTAGMGEMRDKYGDQNSAAMTNFSAAFKDFELSLGRLSGPSTNNVLRELAGMFESLSHGVDWFHNFKMPNWFSRGVSSTTPSLVMPNKAQPVVVHNHVYVGGDKVGSAVTKAVAKNMQSQYDHGSTQTNSAYIGTTPAINSGGVGSL